jgi:hypothetical protein
VLWLELDPDMEPLVPLDWSLVWLEALVPEGVEDDCEVLVCAAIHALHTRSNNPDNNSFLITSS